MQPLMFPDSTGRLKTLAETALLPAIRIQIEDVPSSQSVFASKFGGMPFTPEGFVWPINPAGRPMEFVGQINFSEIVAQTPSFSDRLPNHGIFQFFYDIDKMVWGYDPNHQDFWRFIWYPTPLSLVNTAYPEYVSFPERAFLLTFQETLSFPDIWSLLSTPEKREEFSEEEREAYQGFTEQARPKHQMLGHSWNIQDDPRFTAQFASNGMYIGNLSYKSDPRTPELLKGMNDWQLLWQIDSDERLGFMWGDIGMLYILIKEEALKRGDFSNVWLDLQCY
jgi:uncharacterized protein YwqG